jgi:NAD(P)-dependent dehydrogenase (short-subunit alcohol dehydrogenase family)
MLLPNTAPITWQKRLKQLDILNRVCVYAAMLQAEAVIIQAVAAHGRVDGVVNCVGSIVLKSAHTTSDADFEQVGSSCAGSNICVSISSSS